MKSPFPGMDPYIEASGLWGDFHDDLINEIKRDLARIAPERYLVRTGDRSYVVLVDSEGQKSHAFVPDVKITAPKPRKRPARSRQGDVAVFDPDADVEPVELRAFVEEEHRETFVDIYEAARGQRLVTSIEILSPSNKQPNTPGWDQYLRKRRSLLLSDANLVEIDLLRGGQRPPMLDPWPASPYTLLVARAKKFGYCRVWPAHFRRRLPPIPVPLAPPDPDLRLDLQPMIEAIYQRSRYARSIDYSRPLTPPLSREESAWLERQRRQA
jgi:hypothetical protein